MIYMAGTGAGGTLKTYCAVVVALSLRLRRVPPRVPFSRTIALEPGMVAK